MAQLLRIAPQVPQVDTSAPRVGPNALQYAGQAVRDFGKTLWKLEDGADEADSVKIASDIKASWDAKLSELNDTVTDPKEFEAQSKQAQQEIFDAKYDTARSDVSKTRIKNRLSNVAIALTGKIEHLGRVKTKDRAIDDYKAATDQLITAATIADSNENQAGVARMFGDLTGTMAARGFLKDPQGELRNFDKKVLTNRADTMILTNAPGFLNAADAGDFKGLGAEELLKRRETARKKMEDDEKAQDRVRDQVKKIVLRIAGGQANNGKLSEAWLQAALSDEIPGITPAEARALKTVNDNPPSGAGGDSVQAIMSEYYLGERNLPRIRATRAKLQHLQGQSDRANPLISKAANELQSDQTAMENQGISRDANAIAKENRAISQLKTTYEAYVDENPFLKKRFGSMQQRDKARIEDTYRKEGPEAAKALLDTLIKQTDPKLKAIEQKHGAALSY